MTWLDKYFRLHRGRQHHERRLNRRRRHQCRRQHSRRHDCQNPHCQGKLCLRDILPGHCARVAGFSPHLSPERRTQLRAYGLAPGYSIRVLQHDPVSVIQVAHTEIALEGELADEIFVSEDPQADSSSR